MCLGNLGYAIPAHRAQGIPVDTSHVVVSESTTRENLYVAMTRGRDHNHAYVATCDTDDSHGAPDNQSRPTAREVLSGVLAHVGAELSATQTIEAEQESWGSIAQLAAEYETIAVAAQRDRWANLLRACALSSDQVDEVLTSDAFGPLAAELRRAEANGHDVGRLLPAVLSRHNLGDADDVAAVLRHRVQLATSQRVAGRYGRRRMIVGLIPEAVGPMDADMRDALDERRVLIEKRARLLAGAATQRRDPWTKRFGDPPTTDRARWVGAVATVAAYRDRYGITGSMPLGGDPATDAQRLDRARAEAALRRATDASVTSGSRVIEQGRHGLEI